MAAAAEALVCEAERLLTLSDYVAAEKASAQACKLASPAHRELLDRACTVAIQSQFETQRWDMLMPGHAGGPRMASCEAPSLSQRRRRCSPLSRVASPAEPLAPPAGLG